MRSTFTALATAASLAIIVPPAAAMQVASTTSAASPLFVLVAQGCGRGFVRGPAGGCRPIVVVRPAVVVRRPIVRPGCGIRLGPIGVRTPC